MTISDEITKLNTNLTDSYTAVSNKGGTLPASENFDNLPNAINSIQTGGTIESLSITPTTSQQTITASGGVDGYSPVNVSAVTSAIDSNIQPQFIRNGVQILGITGTYGEPLPAKVMCGGSATCFLIEGNLYYSGNYTGSGGSSSVKTFTLIATNVKDFSMSNNGSTFYIDNNDDLYGCGYNFDGQQGSGNTTTVTTFTKRASGIKYVFCSQNATWYIDNNDDLYGCGNGSNGEQGNGSTSDVYTFTKRASGVKKVINTGQTTWYLTYNGDLYGCGANGSGQQGSGNTTTVTTFTLRASGVKDFACTKSNTLYIDNNDDLYGCGYKNALGVTQSSSQVKTFTLIASNVKEIILYWQTEYVTFYIDNNDDLYGCGLNSSGEQGSGDTTTVTTFTKRASGVKKAFCCSSFGGSTWYIDNNDNLYGCGKNSDGQQGSGDTTNVTTFTLRGTGVKYINCSTTTTFYITNNNEVYGCGDGTSGKQGNGGTTDVLTFTKRN